MREVGKKVKQEKIYYSEKFVNPHQKGTPQQRPLLL
jgi:hypothetical protein